MFSLVIQEMSNETATLRSVGVDNVHRKILRGKNHFDFFLKKTWNIREIPGYLFYQYLKRASKTPG